MTFEKKILRILLKKCAILCKRLWVNSKKFYAETFQLNQLTKLYGTKALGKPEKHYFFAMIAT